MPDELPEDGLMPWARLEDNYFTHGKVVGMSKDAKLLDLAGIAYSARELRDGFLTHRDVHIVAAQVDVEDVAACLVELSAANRWTEREDGQWEIHDYLAYNPTREKVLADRAKTAERVAKLRAGRRGPDGDPAAGGNAPRNAAGNARRNGVTTPPVTHSPDPVPDPVLEIPATQGSLARTRACEGRPAAESNKGKGVLDAIRAAGFEAAPIKADFAAIKTCPRPAHVIASAYAALAGGEWGDEWARERLSIRFVISRLAGYEAWKTTAADARVVPFGRRRRADHGDLDGIDMGIDRELRPAEPRGSVEQPDPEAVAF